MNEFGYVVIGVGITLAAPTLCLCIAMIWQSFKGYPLCISNIPANTPAVLNGKKKSKNKGEIMIYKEPIPNKSIWKSQQDEVEWLKRKHMLFSKTPKPVPDFYAKLNAFVVAADGDYLTRSYYRFKKAIHTAPEAEENRVQQVIYEAMKKADKSMNNGWEGSARATLHSALTEQTEELLNHPSSKVEWFKEWKKTTS